jgi:hypothetical protein
MYYRYGFFGIRHFPAFSIMNIHKVIIDFLFEKCSCEFPDSLTYIL